MGLFRAKSSMSAADTLRPLLYGDLPIDRWPDHEADAPQQPWAAFAAARDLVHQGRETEALAFWAQIAASPGIESRHTLQAWHFLRSYGVTPPNDVASEVLGAVAEVAVGAEHDLLVAYRDGSVRYLNHSGKVAIIEPQAATVELVKAARAWLAVAAALADVVGVWDQPDLPPLPSGHTRILMLTPGGMRFGQGADAKLRLDAPALAYLSAATKLLQAVVSLAV